MSDAIIIIIVFVVLIGLSVGGYFLYRHEEDKKKTETYNYPPSIPAAYLEPGFNPYFDPWAESKPAGYKPYEYNKILDSPYLFKRYNHDPNGARPYVYVQPYDYGKMRGMECLPEGCGIIKYGTKTYDECKQSGC